METNQPLQPIITDLVTKLSAEAENEIAHRIKYELDRLDLRGIIEHTIKQAIGNIEAEYQFPPGSIPHTSVNFGGVKFSGGMIKGGVIEDFGSIGIDDRASHVQLTVMDHATVFESPLYSSGLDIRGDATISGNVTIGGDVTLSGSVSKQGRFFQDLVDHAVAGVTSGLNDTLFERFTHIVYKEIAEKGLDLSQIRYKNKEVLNEAGLGYHIVDSNLQRVGLLKDLQTQGETLLSETFFVGNKRVGVNTLEPGATFVVWDHECEMVVCKRSENQGYIGTQRYQGLTLGSNNKDNIILTPEGVTKIDKLQIKNVPMTSSLTLPNYEGQRGEIIWNENPYPGAPIGWVCVGKNQWGTFGIIA